MNTNKTVYLGLGGGIGGWLVPQTLEGPSRLSRSRFKQMKSYFAAFLEILTIELLLHSSKLEICSIQL